jgi:hypothetical protein
LEPIEEENALVSAGIDLDHSKARSKKIEQLLNKVKKVTSGEGKSEKPLLALPSSSQSLKSKGEEDTFITGGGIKSSGQTDEELTEAALLRQYEELAAKDKNFGKKQKGKKKTDGYYDIADEVLDELDDTEREMNDMLKYLQEMQDYMRSG